MLEQFFKMPVAQKVMLLGVILVLVGLGFWQGYYAPLTEDLVKEENSHKKMVSKLEKVKKQEKTYNQDMQRREDLKIASVKQRQVLPIDSEMASFLDNLDTVAELTGLKIHSVKPQEEEPDKYYARIPVGLKLSGSYLQLAKFFYQVGKLDRIINIENINLSAPSVSESGVVMRATVLATTFRVLKADG